MRSAYTLVTFAALLLPLAVSAQTVDCSAGLTTDSARTLPDRPPDVIIRASVSARTLRFSSSPRVDVRTTGCAPMDSVTVTERVNLPDPVEPGVTYRDVRVGIEIRSWFDVRCFLPQSPAAGPAADTTARGAAPDPCARLLVIDSLLAPTRRR